MSISAMKQALEALETDPCKENAINNAQFFIKQAIAEAEKQPVHPIDTSQEFVDKTAKYRHEWVEQPDLARVGEVGVWGDKREWVELTHLEIGNLWADSQEVYSFAKAIEVKLKEKNT